MSQGRPNSVWPPFSRLVMGIRRNGRPSRNVKKLSFADAFTYGETIDNPIVGNCAMPDNPDFDTRVPGAVKEVVPILSDARRCRAPRGTRGGRSKAAGPIVAADLQTREIRSGQIIQRPHSSTIIWSQRIRTS